MATVPDGDSSVSIDTLKRFVGESLEEKPDHDTDTIVGKARQAGTVISVVVVGVVALVGLLIFGSIFDALPLNDAVFSAGGALEGIPSDIVAGFGDAIGLVPIILLVLLASVVLGVVQNMRMST